MVSVVCVLCELGHVRKKRRRLADEKPHVGKECESTHGDAFRVRWSNDRNNRKARIQERTRLWHDQVRLEELAAKWRRIQIRESHRHTCHGIDSSQGRRVARLIRPCLKVHGLGRPYADQDSYGFLMGRPLCQ